MTYFLFLELEESNTIGKELDIVLSALLARTLLCEGLTDDHLTSFGPVRPHLVAIVIVGVRLHHVGLHSVDIALHHVVLLRLIVRRAFIVHVVSSCSL